MLTRLQLEVGQCTRDAPHILSSDVKKTQGGTTASETGLTSLTGFDESTAPEAMDTTLSVEEDGGGGGGGVAPVVSEGADEMEVGVVSGGGGGGGGGGGQCMPERAALIKSILNFLKKAIPEPTFADSMRSCKY